MNHSCLSNTYNENRLGTNLFKHVLLGSYYRNWSYKYFDPYFLDQPVRIFVNGGKFSNQYNRNLRVVTVTTIHGIKFWDSHFTMQWDEKIGCCA